MRYLPICTSSPARSTDWSMRDRLTYVPFSDPMSRTDERRALADELRVLARHRDVVEEDVRRRRPARDGPLGVEQEPCPGARAALHDQEGRRRRERVHRRDLVRRQADRRRRLDLDRLDRSEAHRRVGSVGGTPDLRVLAAHATSRARSSRRPPAFLGVRHTLCGPSGSAQHVPRSRPAAIAPRRPAQIGLIGLRRDRGRVHRVRHGAHRVDLDQVQRGPPSPCRRCCAPAPSRRRGSAAPAR